MKLVKLKGKTKHGKQRIKQHGEWWKVEYEETNKIHLTSLEETFTVKPGLKTTDGRWLDLPTDRDFEIVERKNDLE